MYPSNSGHTFAWREAPLQMLSECNPALVWVAGPDAQCTYMNQARLDFTGRRLEQEIGDGWIDGIHPDDRRHCVETYLDAFRERKPFTMSYRLRRADGAFRWVQDTAAPCRREDGTLVGYVGSCIDVTDLRHALLETEERFRLLVHGVKDYAVVMTDVEGRVASWNEGAERMVGYSAAEAVGRSCASFFSIEDQARNLLRAGLDSAKSLGTVEVEGWLVRKDGSRLLACSSITALRDESGRLRGYGKIVRDITERRMLEAELRRAKDRLQMLIDVSPLAIVLLDRIGRIRLWNPAAQRLFGWTREDVFQAIAPMLDGADVRGIPHELRGDRLDGVELVRRGMDGENLDVALWTAPCRTDDEPGTLCIYADVGERNRNLNKLKDANARLRRMSERILEIQEQERCHIARELHDEIGQVMTAVKLKLEAAHSRQSLHDCLPMIRESVAMCDSALSGVRRLLLGLRTPQLDHLGLVAAIRWHLDRQASAAGFAVRFRAGDIPRFEPHLENAVFRVLQESLTNVVRHAGATKVRVVLRARDRRLLLMVRDNGRGFDAGRRDACNPHCMGLSGMEERVALAGGRLAIRSAPGTGTTISATIPIDRRL